MTCLIHRSLVAVALLATLLAIVPVVDADPADAQMRVAYARVTNIVDGDTFDVAWDQGYPAPTGMSQPNRIRVLGVDTNEVASGECFADAAENYTANRIPVGTIVRLESRDRSSAAAGRPLRHVFYGSGYRNNLALRLIGAGLGLAASYDDEPDYRSDYFGAVEGAVLDGVGMWAEGACGGNPDSWPDLDVHVNWDAAGSDNDNPNGEWIEIENNGPGTLTMTGWTFRSSARKSGGTLSIPSGTRITAGSTLRIRMGSGTNTSRNIYMGRSSGWFDNEGDIFYLRDNNLNVRGFQVWPCTTTCGRHGTLVIEEVVWDAPGDDNANPNGEWVRVRNVGNGALDIGGWKLQDNGVDYFFDDGTVLAEGQALRVRVGSGTDTSSTVYWGNRDGILANSGDALWIFSDRHVPVDCYDYGNASCEDEPVRGAIRLTAQYDAKGNDARHPNREWIALENTSDDRVDLSGYRVRVGSRTYVFASGTRVSPGKRLRLRIGSGSDTTANVYWGNPAGILLNGGGSVQLRNPANEVVLEHRWPCGADCGPDGPFSIDRVVHNPPGPDDANPNGEYVRIVNDGTVRASLRDYQVKAGSRQYLFLTNVWLDPGEKVTIRIGRGTDTSRTVYWGQSGAILRNAGKRVTLATPYRERVDCHAWGDKSC